jgi:hypothetical protein
MHVLCSGNKTETVTSGSSGDEVFPYVMQIKPHEKKNAVKRLSLLGG